MATSFPGSIQKMERFADITLSDAPLIAEYQRWVELGNTVEANRTLESIPNYSQKIITAEKLNTMIDTLMALQTYYLERYSSSYIVSKTKPASQKSGDFWFRILD